MRLRSHSRRPLHGATPMLAAAALLTAGAALSAGAASPAGASPASDRPVAHALFSGGRTTDLRVGEPLAVTWRGERIGRICWQPAPIQRFSCSTQFAAPAKTGTQSLQVKTDGGRTATLELRIGAASRTLPTSAAGAGAGHAVPYVFTCGTTGRLGSGAGARRDPEAVAHTGDRLAAYYRVGRQTIQGFVYKTNVAAFYDAKCLRPVR